MSAELDETQSAGRDSRPGVPARVSRFEVQRKLGEGGNGVVLLARDPTLDRKVAIKILRRTDDLGASQRLLREAQSAAKLTHDNVIVVHEVGTFEEQVYVAMEHVAGGTLASWQATHTWREILDVYVRAGRGLAAAHAAGMVHRDFKPDNVLVGDDGRVRVTDFGLVSVSGTEAVAPSSLDGTALATTLTRSGTVMGTPRYMAPEQHLGETVDARADQFAFCIALYEGLFGRPPFGGATYGAIADRVTAGELTPPPADSPVPRAIRDAIVRGLSRDPAARWPSMTELLAALAPPAARPRWWLVAAVLAVVIVAALAVFLVERSRRDHGEQAVDVFSRAQAAFERGDYPAAAAGFRRVFELDPDLGPRGATYVYNIAVAHDKMGHCVDAVTTYRQYLALSPKATDRAKVEARLAELGDCKPREEGAGDVSEIMKAAEADYNRQDFAAAIVGFKRAYALDPNMSTSPRYLYDLAQAYRQMKNCREASFAYKRFLELRPDLAPTKRAEIESMVKELDDCVAVEGGSAAP